MGAAPTRVPAALDGLDRPSAVYRAAYTDFEDAVRYLEDLRDAAIKPVVLAEMWAEDHPDSTFGPEAVAAAREVRELLSFLIERLYDARRLAARQAYREVDEAERRTRWQAGRGVIGVAVGFALLVLADHLLIDAMAGMPHLLTGGQS